MKKINILFILAVAMVTFTGCDKDEWLDIKPFGKTIPSTVEEFRLLMDERQSFTGATSIGRAPMYDIDLYMSDELRVRDGEHENYISFNGNDTRFFNALIWEEDFCSLEETDRDWSNLYNHILISNIVLDAMDDPEITGDADLRNTLRAEAKVHRAYAHFSLVNLYSKQYDPATAANDLGIPVRLSKDPEGSLARSTVQEVYDLVLQDLDDAIQSESLPDGLPSVTVRPSLASAYAILAKVHLAMGNYDDALEAADNSLQLYSFLYDYNSLFVMPNNYENLEVMMLKAPGLSAGFPAQLYISNELVAAYGISDRRLNLRYSLDFFSGEYTISKGTFFSTRVIGPTVAEMYLIRAECNARTGDVSAVEDDLNAVRVNRISSFAYTPTAEFTDRDNALDAVKQERYLELAAMGVRLFDLKRYNVFDNADISLSRTIDGTEYTLEPNSNKWIVPVARNLIQQNPEIEQSPR